MTLTVDLSPETDAWIQQKAARLGISAGAYLQRLVEQARGNVFATASATSHRPFRDRAAEQQARWDAMSPEEREAAEQELDDTLASLVSNPVSLSLVSAEERS